MPISLHIDAENSRDLVNQLTALAAALTVAASPAATVTAAEQPADPKPARSTKSAKQDTVKGSEPTTATDASAPSETGSTATSTASPSEGVTKEQVTALCNQYGAKAGATALQEIFKNEMGSPQGKFSGVTEDKYPALAARLTELLNA